jgi:hypothetical protein
MPAILRTKHALQLVFLLTTGTVEGNTFTMNNEGMLFVYKK